MRTLKCECGSCNVCKSRERYREKVRQKAAKKGYPPAGPGQVPETDNFGYPPGSGRSSKIPDNGETREHRDKINELEERILRQHIRNGNRKTTYPEFLELVDHTMLGLDMAVSRSGKTLTITISPPRKSPAPEYIRMGILEA